MLSSLLGSVLGELLYVAGPACLWWVWPLAGKLLLALVLLCRGLGTHRVLRLPVGSLLCLLLALDLLLYFFVRLLIIAAEACSLRRRRERVLEAATDYEAWREAASSLDSYERRDAWRQKPESALYDWRQAQATTLRLRAAREAAKPEVVMALLLPCLKPNAFGVLEGEIYRSARAGTKHAIEELVDEIAASLGWLAKLDLDPGVPGRAGGQCGGQWSKAERAALKAERAAFLAAARLSLGKPALLLSGGGILSVYHFGAVRALLELGMLPQLVSGTSGGAVVAAVVATRGDAELRRVLREATERPEQSDLYRELGSEGPLHGSYWWKARRLYLPWSYCLWLHLPWLHLPWPHLLRPHLLRPHLLRPHLLRPHLLRPHLLWQARQLLRQGRLYDSQDFARHLQWFTLGLTFKEAYERTGRVLNITCTPLRSRGHLAPPLMLNHIDTPHVGTASSNTQAIPQAPPLTPDPHPRPPP